MIVWARFETVEDQHQFFLDVKRALGTGSTKLARELKLPSGVRIDWWSMCKCAPPVWVVNELSKLSGVTPPKFDEVNGIVIRKKRRMPSGFKKRYIVMNEECANKILVSKFGKWVQKINEMIMKDMYTKDILKQLRKDGYSFDTGKMSTAINSIIKNKELRIRDKIDGHGCAIIKGNVSSCKNSFILSLCSKLFARKIKNKSTYWNRIR